MIPGPDTKYMMMHEGAWRPVTTMINGRGLTTITPTEASSCVLYMHQGWNKDPTWVVISNLSPWSLLLRDERQRPTSRWFPIDE